MSIEITRRILPSNRVKTVQSEFQGQNNRILFDYFNNHYPLNTKKVQYL